MSRRNNTKDAYNDSRYDPQYLDENGDGDVLLDHNKLYVTNIPKGLNEQGLESVFAKYGDVTRIHLSKDPLKRYAIVTFVNPSDARAAMMKLNKSEPLKLSISVAHAQNKKSKQDYKERDYKQTRLSINYDGRSTSEDCEDVGRNFNHWNAEAQSDMYEEEMLDDDIDMEEDVDLDVRLQMLKLQEAEIKIKQQKLLLQSQPRRMNQQSNRCFMADGRIIVRNVGDRAVEPDAHSSAGGDSYTIPALQREASRACVACGAPADAFCARCGVAPYCGARCQRSDWNRRHRAVCHNLARVPPAQPPAQPLRRPHTQSRSHEQGGEDNDSQKVQKNQARESGATRNNRPQQNNRNYPKQNNSQNNNTSGRQNGRLSDRAAEEEESFEIPKPQTPQSNKPAQKTTPTKPEEKTVAKPVPVAKPPPPAHPEPAAAKVAAHPEPAAAKVAAPKPQPAPEPVPKPAQVATVVPPGSVASCTPERKIIPKKYLLEALTIGSTLILTVEAKAATQRPGFVCLAIHESTAELYQTLCDQFGEDCEVADKYTPTSGETFSYLNPADGAWYRARCLSPAAAALIDSGTIVTIVADNCRRLPAKYEDVVEFCCQLDAKGIQVGDQLNCELVEKVGQSYKVSLIGEKENLPGELFRWLPPVEAPPPTVVLPEVPRPAVTPGSVVLVEGDAERCFVRAAHAAAQRSFDQVLQEVLLRGLQGQLAQLKEPPQKGDIVVGKFTDGHHYRALCKRTNVKQDKYMLEYIEYGNIHIGQLADLFECPADLTLKAEPTVVSLVKLRLSCGSLTPPATQYLEQLRDDAVELTLSLADGSPSGASGCEVCLTVTKGGESVNKRLDELSTPQWKQLQQNGVDVVATSPIMLSDPRLRYLELPADGCEVEVLDASMLDEGLLSACPARHPDIARVFNELSEQMAEYCTSDIGSDPYLPRLEETCIAYCEDTGRWMRAVVCVQDGGAGGGCVRVCMLDTGGVRDLPVARLRKMLPDFLQLPVLSSLLEVRGFPKEPTQEMLAKARAHMELADNRGKLRVTKCVKEDSAVYTVEAPDLLRAML